MKILKINNADISQLVDYLKINKEANSDKRYSNFLIFVLKKVCD